MIIIASNYLWIKQFSVSDAHEHTYSFLFIYRSSAPDTLHIHIKPPDPNFVSVNITGSERNPSNHHTMKKAFLPNHIILGLHISTNSKYLNNLLFVSLSDVLNTSTIRLLSNIYPSVATFSRITHLLAILQPHFLYAHLQKDVPSNLHQFYRRITYRLPFEPETHLVRSQHHECFRFGAV